jgi:hypothetical protein
MQEETAGFGCRRFSKDPKGEEEKGLIKDYQSKRKWHSKNERQ